MRLVRGISEHVVWCEFLRTEYKQYLPKSLWAECERLTTSPNLENKGENDRRLKLLRSFRSPIVDSIPKDTVWQEVALAPEEFAQLHVIRSGDWISLSECTGKLKRVAENLEGSNRNSPIRLKVEKIIQANEPHSDWKLILIRVKAGSTMTIVDGCHRATALYTQHFIRRKLVLSEVTSFVGTSPFMDSCRWLFP